MSAIKRRTLFSFLMLVPFGSEIAEAASQAEKPGDSIINKQKALDAQTWWDNRDWDWYKSNIPFFDCPDTDIVKTWYYRWELITKHLTYGSPNSGYSFTEFIDRPFWSGTYGAISCAAGHHFYELRWLRDPEYVRDYARYWFRTPGAQPRNYGTWLADSIWATQAVHPDNAFIVDLLPDLKKNYEGWEKRQFVPEMGLFWQNGHDDGMEFNINSRQTKDILRGANGYRPGFNAYMYADALAIADVARLAGESETVKTYRGKAAMLKTNVQKLLWDPKRQFFFPMSMRDEEDAEGNVVKAHTLTYQTGKYAGSPHGREEHGYIPWQFGMLDSGYESAWKFLMDPDYFFAPFGPTSVERHDPQFVLKTSCCWWSGQSWPFATAQTLKAMANVLQGYRQSFVKPADYVKLLNIFARSHRKDGVPYLAEALNPDTGSFAGHDNYNHSEHYFHSSFNDLVITGLVGIVPRHDNVLELKPLAPAEWPYFALDDVPYRGHTISILWDRDGTRYKKGKGLRVLVNGKTVVSKPTLAPLTVSLPTAPQVKESRPTVRFNYAVNNDGDYYPRLSATYTAPATSLEAINDGNYRYTIDPPNRWTTSGSPNKSDSVEIDFGTSRHIDTVTLALLDDGKGIVVPQSITLEGFDGQRWNPIPPVRATPQKITGHRFNSLRFAPTAMSRLRVTFVHAAGGFTGLTEIEAWGPGTFPYVSPPARPGNLALNQTGQGFPKASASFHDVYGGLPVFAIDGRLSFKATPSNRWTSYGSPNKTDWLEVDFGTPKEVRHAEISIYDDKGGVQAPESYTIEFYDGQAWQPVKNLKKSPEQPVSGTNTALFAPVTTSKIRVVFTHQGEARSGVTELELRND